MNVIGIEQEQEFYEEHINSPCAITSKQNSESETGPYNPEVGQHDASVFVKMEVQEDLLKDALNFGGENGQALTTNVKPEASTGTPKDSTKSSRSPIENIQSIDRPTAWSNQQSASFRNPKRPRHETHSEGQNTDQVDDLLRMWHLFDDLHVFFMEHGLTIESLPKLTEGDLSDIFKGRRIAKKLMFREKLIAWKAEKRYPPAVTLDSANSFENQSQPAHIFQTTYLPQEIVADPSENQSQPSSSTDPIAKCQCNHQANSTTATATISSESTPSSAPAFDFSLDSFFASGTGKKIVQRYNTSNVLEPSDRDALVAGIVREHLDRNICMTLSMFEKIGTQICQKFPNEKKEFYIVKNPKASGKLYNKYRSMATSFKKAGLLTSRLRTNNSPSVSDSICIIQEDSQQCEEQQDDKEWLKTSDAPWETVEEKWKSTFSLRRRDISNGTLSQILEDWPSLAHRNGYRLIELDFDALYPGKSNLLLSKWAVSEPAILRACNKFVKFLPAKNLLTNFSPSPEVRIYEIFQVVQALVKPVARKLVDDHIWKVSIVDAWNCFAVEAHTMSDVIPLLTKRKKYCISRGIALQPFLVVIKESVQFILVWDGLQYIFSSFLEALDIYFKIFFVLNLQYPFENPQFWQFIQTFFFEINVATDQPCQYQELMWCIETSEK